MAEATEKLGRLFPITKDTSFDLEKFHDAPKEHRKYLMQSVIKTKIEHIESTQKSMKKNSSLVWKFDGVQELTKLESGVAEDPLFEGVISQRISEEDEDGIGIALLLVGLAAGILSGGTGAVAMIAAGVSVTAGFVELDIQVNDYVLESKAHSAGAIVDEPSVLGIVLTIVGLGLDVAAIGKLAKALIRGDKATEVGKAAVGEAVPPAWADELIDATTTFNKSIDKLEALIQLERRVSGIVDKGVDHKTAELLDTLLEAARREADEAAGAATKTGSKVDGPKMQDAPASPKSLNPKSTSDLKLDLLKASEYQKRAADILPLNSQEGTMAMLPSEDPAEVLRYYYAACENTPTKEIGLYYNFKADTYVLVQGGEGSVPWPSKQPQDLVDTFGADHKIHKNNNWETENWELPFHSHPRETAKGVSDIASRAPSWDDLEIVRTDAIVANRTKVGIASFTTEAGPARIMYSYDPEVRLFAVAGKFPPADGVGKWVDEIRYFDTLEGYVSEIYTKFGAEVPKSLKKARVADLKWVEFNKKLEAELAKEGKDALKKAKDTASE